MEKRHLIKAVAMTLVMIMMLGLLGSTLADEELTIGTLSYLNMTETEDTLNMDRDKAMITLLKAYGVLEGNPPEIGGGTTRHYDSLDAMLMALQAGEIKAIKVPYYTAKYLTVANDGLAVLMDYHPEKANRASQIMINILSDGYSFMTKEENSALRDDFDAQIAAMKEDGTLQNLIDEHIIKAAENGEPVTITFEQFEGDPIRIAVTGSLPPMDYVAADGSFAGFNTAVLAEIGKRLQKNIELVQVDSIGRALALSEGTVDVVFWTRGTSQGVLDDGFKPGMTEEEQDAKAAELQAEMTEEEKAAIVPDENPSTEDIQKIVSRDMPEGTIITQPYFTDFPVLVVLK